MEIMIEKRVLYIFILFALIGSVGIGSEAFCENSKKPLVAIEPIRCVSPSHAYVGKALTEMLVTRLSSEDIDTVVMGKTGGKETLAELADFILSGSVTEKAGHFDASFELRSPNKDKPIKDWNIVAPTLGMLAKKASLLSAKMADTIKNTGEVLVADTVSSFAGLSGPGSKKIQANDEFEMARLHPDILVRERLEKDEEKEIAQHKNAGSNALPRGSAAESEDEDSYMPLPDVYDSGDDVSEQELKNRVETNNAPSVQKEEDDNSFFPLPDVYDPDDDENAVDTPKVENAKKTESSTTGEGGSFSSPGRKEQGQQSKKTWYSRLWPFGKSGNEDQAPAVSKAKETRLQKEKEDKEPIVVASNNKLPIPPPPHLDFHIPEPVPLDKALSEIENISVEKKEEKGWLSRLWPWGEEEERVVVRTASSESKPATHQSSSQKGLQAFNSGAEIEAMRRAVGAETSSSPAPSVEYPGREAVKHEEEPVQSQETNSVPSGDTGDHEQIQGPIWQWN